jgi:integrase
VVSEIGERAGVKVSTDPVTKAVKYASAHDLRRSFGTRWAARLMPQQLMELMRHESITTTMRFYVGRNATTTADALWAAHEAAGGSVQAVGITLGDTSPNQDASEVSHSSETPGA